MTNIRWTPEKLQEEALKYKTRMEFHKNTKWGYEQAKKMGIFERICSHMPKHADQSGKNAGRFKWTFEKLKEEASKYTSRIDFIKKSNNAYSAARRNGFLDKICNHMEYLCHPWQEKEIREEALKYKSRSEFQKKNRKAYKAAAQRGILNEVCSHMYRPDPKPRLLKH